MFLTSGRGYACVFPQDYTSPVWILDRLTHHVTVPWAPGSPLPQPQKKKSTPLLLPPPPTWKVQQTLSQPAVEIPKEPPTKQVSRFYIKDRDPP